MPENEKENQPGAAPVEEDNTNKEETIQPIKNPLKAQLVKITKDGKSVNAVIARSFARQDIGRAYKVMAEYGKICFDLLKK